ncbi:diuretic hormone receptor-like isoform X1 [Varroa jacobsoni]|uniref:diuretic hormone receptor-like isoform X1 n=2 Tax=Varroa jacobsoni TaxID=62625 RepID=UPI000BF3C70B|nr:diuretic hormone receptor-like isoform X1 [Varroa jacobsoni]
MIWSETDLLLSINNKSAEVSRFRWCVAPSSTPLPVSSPEPAIAFASSSPPPFGVRRGARAMATPSAKDSVMTWDMSEPVGNGTDNSNALSMIDCLLNAYNSSLLRSSSKYCNATWDGLSCWPLTQAGRLAEVPCFESLNGLYYDTSKNVTRRCFLNGTWHAKSDYSNCVPLISIDNQNQTSNIMIYSIGYGCSMVALIIAIWIFIYYKDLRCLRNTIHLNLMVTYLLTAIVWFTIQRLILVREFGDFTCYLYIPLTYLMGTSFFWMFVEGLYLYILVVKTFSVELVKLSAYMFIGWGTPAAVVLCWAIVKKSYTTDDTFSENSPNEQTYCVWRVPDMYDLIFSVPVIAVLIINIFFLAQIMWVLITKLRAATTAESQQYRKAAKALLVLIPLLGGCYILVITTPNEYKYLQALFIPTQGLTVAVLYCFMNGEVRNSVRHHIERWKTMRALGSHHGARHSRLYKDDRRESRHTRAGSCVSFTTSVTCANNALNYKDDEV